MYIVSIPCSHLKNSIYKNTSMNVSWKIFNLFISISWSTYIYLHKECEDCEIKKELGSHDKIKMNSFHAWLHMLFKFHIMAFTSEKRGWFSSTSCSFIQLKKKLKFLSRIFRFSISLLQKVYFGFINLALHISPFP